MQAQLGACEVQMVAEGAATSASSRVPARTKTKCGRASELLRICVPHTGQNLRCMTLPLSATLRKSERLPSMASALLGKQTFTEPLPAARYWQRRHQQTRVSMGGALMR